MRKKRNGRETTGSSGFALSFLDVLCCGLGAAILLLLVVRHGVADVELENDAFVTSQVERLERELVSKIKTKANVIAAISTTEKEMNALLEQRKRSRSENALSTEDLQKQLASLTENRKRLQDSRARLQAATEARNAQSHTEESINTEQEIQLTGLKVRDSKVVVLLDRSASMLDPSLVEIIRLQTSSIQVRQRSEKWVTAKEATKWIFDKIRPEGRYQILTYSNVVHDLSGTRLDSNTTAKWMIKSASARDSRDIHSKVDSLLPQGPTNLSDVFKVVGTLSPRPDQVILITDGLPTLPGNVPLSRIKRCPRQRQGVTPMLTSACRHEIFYDAVNRSRDTLQFQIDTILLPLSGDADAVYAYWKLSARSGGRLLTPAPGWPDR